jgi:molybdopterin converting factor small subunit
MQMPPEATVADVLTQMRERFPEFEAGLKGKGLRRPQGRYLYQLFVNARPVAFDEGTQRLLHDGDRIYLFLPVAGG